MVVRAGSDGVFISRVKRNVNENTRTRRLKSPPQVMQSRPKAPQIMASQPKMPKPVSPYGAVLTGRSLAVAKSMPMVPATSARDTDDEQLHTDQQTPRHDGMDHVGDQEVVIFD